MKIKKPKLTLGDKQQHRHDLIPLIVIADLTNSERDNLSAAALLKQIQMKVSQSIRRFQHTFGEKNV